MQTDKLDINIHIGAHKTASTHLQRLLLRNAARLSAKGCAYFGPNRLRHDLRLPPLCVDRPANERVIAPLVSDLRNAAARGQNLVVSEENILGTTRADIIARADRLYPDADGQIARFLRLVGGRNATLYMAVRSPLSFINSAYVQQIKGGNLCDFETYVAGFDPPALRWSELVVRLLACPGVGRLVIWRFEDYAQVLPDILRHLLGAQAAAGLRLSSTPHQVGSSARAIEHARARLNADPALNPKTVVTEAEQLYPKSAQWPGPDAFGADVMAAGQQSYAHDLQALRAMARVTFLAPGAERKPGSRANRA